MELEWGVFVFAIFSVSIVVMVVAEIYTRALVQVAEIEAGGCYENEEE